VSGGASAGSWRRWRGGGTFDDDDWRHRRRRRGRRVRGEGRLVSQSGVRTRAATRATSTRCSLLRCHSVPGRLPMREPWRST
jgi:hypothetical protein